MAIAQVKSDRRPKHFTGLHAAAKPTDGTPYGATYYETDTTNWYIYTAAGWVQESLPGIAATLAALPALVAGESHIGEVGGNAEIIQVTPTITAGPYSANDIVGGLITLTGAMRISGGKGYLTDLLLIDVAKQNAALYLDFFSGTLAGTYNDNDAATLTAADALKWLGTIPVAATDWVTRTNFSQAQIPNALSAVPVLMVKAVGSANLYLMVRTVTTPTFAHTNDLTITCKFDRY